ncbi:MAG: metallophosphatase [Prevotella sp.]|nr:metallophosphatase [Prevotella sp.]
MRTIRTIILSIFSLLAGTLFAQKELVILHTNDVHSCIMPQSQNLADTMLAGRGGFIRRIAMLEQERQKTPGLLLFDSGDFSQGSPYYTLFKGDVEVGLMNQMHYDALTIGNHEFDYGLKNLARVLGALKCPVVCANYKFHQYGLDKIVKPYIIIKRNGLKIGVFGLGPEFEGLVGRENYEQTEYLDPIKSAQQTADLLRRKKCDLVVCLSHLGWEEQGMGDQMLISHTRGIDLVLGGHSHTYFQALRYVKNLDGKDIPVDQNGKMGLFVGKMEISLTPLTPSP